MCVWSLYWFLSPLCTLSETCWSCSFDFSSVLNSVWGQELRFSLFQCFSASVSRGESSAHISKDWHTCHVRTTPASLFLPPPSAFFSCSEWNPHPTPTPLLHTHPSLRVRHPPGVPETQDVNFQVKLLNLFMTVMYSATRTLPVSYTHSNTLFL